MIIDGKKLAEEIKNTLDGKGLKLAIVQVGEDEASKKFIEKKIKFAEDIGAKTRVYNLPADITTNKLRQKMAEISHILENDGVILQLPLPAQIKTQYVLNGIIVSKDVDVLSSRAFGDFATGHSKILPPVVGAIKKIFDQYNIDIKNKNIVVVGAGRLVGRPVAVWLMNQGATISVINEFTPDISEFTKKADIIISGAGKPGLIKSEIVKDGVVIIDAGFPVGDADPAVADKSSLFTPVPGGIGPLTVAMVFKNLIELNK
ncbi:MAG: bifunctional 5,10-methylenetetrahydrofolate dehydrogenase/5,10-methenyltetrahydrofolate cyclohydrolase [Candidatus Parcubacteria bacterium]|nr:bifunctional 5,10-methylenetetrahydrofolate dehydrogenase/5,10-methenyltetrahydrofolate cyclohydrolase [Candidatus Parcubacteria bacterium]